MNLDSKQETERTLARIRGVITKLAANSFENKAGFDPNQPRNPDGTWGDQGGEITDDEFNAIKGYTNWDYRGINTYLITGEFPPGTPVSDQERIERQVVEIRSGLTKLPDYKGATYRGDIFRRPERWAAFKSNLTPGSEYSYGGFMSTTRDFEQANLVTRSDDKPLARVTFKIMSKSGKNIETISKYVSEREVLFTDKTKFIVDKVVDLSSSFLGDTNTRYEVSLIEK